MIRRWELLRGDQVGQVWEWNTDTHFGGWSVGVDWSRIPPAVMQAWENGASHHLTWREISDPDMQLDSGL